MGPAAGRHDPRVAGRLRDGRLFFPLSFALVAVALIRLGRRWQGVLVLVAMIAWPVAHIGDIAVLAVVVNVVLVVAFGGLVWPRASERDAR